MSRESWISFIPHHTAADLTAHPEASPVGREQRFEAVTLFADVSGFTAISEALARTGKSGTEELTRILNSYFEPMIALIESYGGIVGKFGGDAMTVLFPLTETNIHDTVRRAVQCALDMQRDMTRYADIPTSAGTFGLSMKAGLAVGAVYCTNVGDTHTRLEFIIAGPAIDGCSEAEHHAERGEVVVDNALMPYLEDLTIHEERGGFSVVEGTLADVTPNPLSHVDVPQAAYTLLQRYIPPTVAGRLEAGREEFIDEHRSVTVLFIAFTEYDYVNDAQVGAKLGDYLAQVVAIVNRYDGTLNKVDMGDKGSKYIVLFGAPISHEDDEHRALRCAIDLNAIPGNPLRIGINTGLVYAGRVGSTARREYTVMGDGVNLSARLMQYAKPGEIIVSAATFDRAGGDAAFQWEVLDAINVKGKSDKISIYRLVSVKARAVESLTLRPPAYALPMVGRAEEMEIVHEKIALAAAGEGQIIGVVGEAGMGKSRLMAEIIKAANAAGMTAYGGACQSYNSDLGYVVWMDVWRGLFGLDPAASAERQISQLESALQAVDPDFMPRLPLVGPVVGLHIPDSDFTTALDLTVRVELLHALLLTCLRHYTSPLNSANSHPLSMYGEGDRGWGSPLLIVLEDMHWIDAQSRALLEYLGRNLSRLPVLLVMAYRPPVDENIDRDFAFMLPAMRFGHFTELRLGRFSPSEAEVLIALKLGQHFSGTVDALSPDFVRRIVERVEGNPFYIDELMNLLRDTNIDPRSEDALEQLALPDSLHNLILARIDRLSENEQIILKVASVIGRIFRASWIPGAYPQIGAAPDVIQRLGRLSDLELTPLDRPEPELEYLFKHITTQEVAYESMAYATREHLHARVGGFIETRYGSVDDFVHVLAFHYGRTQEHGKQRVYFRKAGDAARSAYSNQAAVRYYRALHPLLADDPAGQIDLLLDIGAVQQVGGVWTEAEEALRSAIAQAENTGDVTRAARAKTALGDLLSYGEGFDEALTLLHAAHAEFMRLEDGAGLARTLRHLSYLHFRQSAFEQARDYATQQLRLAEQETDPVVGARTIADGHHNLGLIDWYTGDLDASRDHFNAAIAAARVADHKQAVIYALNNLSGLLFTSKDYAQAMRSAREVLDLASEIGYVRVMGLVLGNLGSVYLEGGRYNDEALACYVASLRMALEIGDWMAASYTLHNLALLHMRLDDRAMADSLLGRAETLARSQRNDDLLCDCAFSRGRLYALNGQHEAALASLDDAVRLAETIEREDVVLEANALRNQLSQNADHPDGIGAALRESLSNDAEDMVALPAVPAIALRHRVALPSLLEELDGVRRVSTR